MGRTASAARRIGAAALKITAFSLPALVLWWHAIEAPRETLTCGCGDTAQTVWFLAWSAHALAHVVNPLSTTALWPPGGVNLMDNASFPAIGLALAPVTWLWGPVASTNAALILAPGVTGWATANLVGRITNGNRPASWVAGFVVAYSSFAVTSEMFAHLGLVFLAPVAWMGSAGYDLWTGKRGPMRQGIVIGLAATVEILTSAEVLAVVAIGAVVAALFVADRAWRRRRVLLRGAAAAVVTGAVLSGWPVWLALDGPEHIRGQPFQGQSDFGYHLAGFVSAGNWRGSTVLVALGGGYTGPKGPPGNDLGWVLIAAALVALAISWRRRAALAAAAVALVGATLSLGGTLSTWPHGRLPWGWLAHVPVIEDILPETLEILVIFGVAVVVALGLARLGRGRWQGTIAVAVLAVSLGPLWATYGAPLRTHRIQIPTYFTRRHPPDTHVLAYPFPVENTFGSAPMLWAAEDGVTLVGGYAKVPSPNGRPLGFSGTFPGGIGILVGISTGIVGHFPKGNAAELTTLRRFADRSGTTVAVVTPEGPGPALATALYEAALDATAHRTGATVVLTPNFTPRWNPTAAARAYAKCASHIKPTAPPAAGIC